MNINISDLMSGYQDDTVDLKDPGITTPERILALTLGAPMPEAPKAPRKIWRTGLIAAVLAVIFIVAAVAAAAPNFYEAAFGDRGLPDIEPIPMSNDNGYFWTAPGIEWASMDIESAEALLGDYVADIDETVTIGNYSITLGSFVMDEHGAGVLTWVIENPDGIPNYTENDRLFLTFAYEEGLCEPQFSTTSGSSLLSYHIRNQALSTETELHLTTYLGHFHGAMENGERIRLTLKEIASIDGTLVERNNTNVVFPSFEAVPAVIFTDGEHMASLTPLSLCMIDSYIPGAVDNWWGTDKSVCFASGNEYILIQEDAWINNLALSFCRHDTVNGGSSGVVKGFNRLIDPSEVSEIRIEAFDGGTLVFTPTKP